MSFSRPENCDKDKEGTDWNLWAGGNDWEVYPTWIWVEGTKYDDVYRIWVELEFPKGAVPDMEGSKEEQKLATEHGQKALKKLKSLFNKTPKKDKHDFSRDSFSRWLDAVRHDEFDEFIRSWGIDSRDWKETDWTKEGNKGDPFGYYESMKETSTSMGMSCQPTKPMGGGSQVKQFLKCFSPEEEKKTRMKRVEPLSEKSLGQNLNGFTKQAVGLSEKLIKQLERRNLGFGVRALKEALESLSEARGESEALNRVDSSLLYQAVQWMEHVRSLSFSLLAEEYSECYQRLRVPLTKLVEKIEELAAHYGNPTDTIASHRYARETHDWCDRFEKQFVSIGSEYI